jgi:hypothetical protein
MVRTESTKSWSAFPTRVSLSEISKASMNDGPDGRLTTPKQSGYIRVGEVFVVPEDDRDPATLG